MAVTPNNSDCVVTLLHHVSGVHVFWYFLDLENLTSVNLVNTSRALALDSQLVRINTLFNLTIVCNFDTCRGGIVVNFFFIWLE